MAFVCWFQIGLEVLLANVDSCLEKYLQKFGKKYDSSMREGEHGGSAGLTINLSSRIGNENLFFWELTMAYCTSQALPGESVAKLVLSNVHNWFMLYKREVKGCLNSFILMTWEFESNGIRIPSHLPNVATVQLLFPWVLLVSLWSTTKMRDAIIRIQMHSPHMKWMIDTWMRPLKSLMCSPVLNIKKVIFIIFKVKHTYALSTL